MTPLWPHQERGIAAVLDRQAAGVRRMCLTSPTGMGKSKCVEVLIQRWVEMDLRVLLYVNRRMLLDQLSRFLVAAGIRYAVRAAGHGQDDGEYVQLASIQTEGKRSVRDRSQDIFPADRVVVDEAHVLKGLEAQKILARHWEAGAHLLGVTATPVDLAEVYDELIVAGTTSEGRACGALLPAIHFGPDEPDFRAIKNWKPGEDLSEAQQRKLFPMGRPLFGRVYENWKKLNPDARPTILFASGVQESVWFAQEFARAGVTAAHIDGEDVWINGTWYKSSRDARQEVLDGSEHGRIKVVTNRFVLREGVDAPWLAHGIFATAFGSVQTYLQAGGRLLRAHPSLQTVTIQDHGGCLDTYTEVLTARGWVGHEDIQDDDTVAAYDRFSGSIRWCRILHRHERVLDPGEQMLEARGRCLNLRVTGNHRILATERDNIDGGKMWRDAYEFMRADDLSASAKRVKVPVAGVQQSPGVGLTDDQLRFLGWWITDGCMSGKRQEVSITQADHQPHIADLRSCLVANGFNYREVRRQPTDFNSQPQTQFQIPKGTCKSRPRKGWWELRHYMDKNLALPLELMDARQFGVFLHAVHLGDGDKKKGDGAYRISTGNKTFADRLQSLAVRRGWKCNIATGEGSTRLNPLYTLNMQQVLSTTLHGSQAKTKDEQIKLVSSASMPGVTRVWCVANELETLITRRNGMVTIIGNSWWRAGLGSLNDDRTWNLAHTSSRIAAEREDRMRATPPDKKPFRCPGCAMILAIRVCPTCGYEVGPGKRPRMVAQTDGTLVPAADDPYPARRMFCKPDTFDLWKKVYFRCRNAGMTFRQAYGLFAHENHHWPPRTLPLMPREQGDWHMRIADVPYERLVGGW